MLRIVRLVTAALVAVLVAVPAATALGAPSAWQSVDVIAQADQQQTILLVSGELPSSAKLPAKAELAVPAGTQLQWIGEILGSDPSKDPELKYVKSTSGGMDIYAFTLTKARIAQVEAILPGAVGFDGTTYSSALKWTAWQALPEVRISQRVPEGSTIAQAAPDAALKPGGSGFSYYTKTVKNPKAGDVLDLTFSYTAPAAAPAAGGAPASSGSDSSVVIIVLAVFVIGFGIVAFSVQRKLAAKSAESESKQPASSKPQSAKSAVAASADETEPSSAETTPRPRLSAKTLIVAVGVVALLVVGAIIAGANGTQSRPVDGKITRSFGAASPCTSASIPVVAAQGVDLAEQGAKVLDAFAGQEGVGDVTLDITNSKVDISFCESSQSEASVRQILSGTGLVTVDTSPTASQ